MAETTRVIPWIKWQKPMVRVLWACAPLALAGIYLFGWRVLALLLACNAAAYGVERLFTRGWREPVSSAVFVTATLFTFSLPPLLPFWMAMLGVSFGVLFGKMVFGGFGRNVFNPAMTGRAFIYISFGRQMTGQWSLPYGGFPGGFAQWGRSLVEGADAITTATPGALLKSGQAILLRNELLGNCAGVIGGTSAVLVVLCGLYLVWSKTASYRIVIAGLLGFALMQAIAWHFGWRHAADPLRAACAGSFLIGIFFYATDPVSAAQTHPGRWIFGAFIGIMSSLIAVFSAWPAGTMFAILLANMFAPIVDHAIKAVTAARKPNPAGGAA